MGQIEGLRTMVSAPTVAGAPALVLVVPGAPQVLELQGPMTGDRPRVEFSELMADEDVSLMDDSAPLCGPRWVTRRLPPWVSTVLRSTRRHRSGTHLLTLSEEVGVRLAVAHVLLQRRRTRPQIAMVCHGSYIASTKFKLVVRLLRGRLSVRYLCLANSIAQQLTATGVPASEVCVVGYAVDTAYFTPRAEDDGRTIVSAGTASRDYETLVRAVSDLDVRLRIAADSAWYRSALNITSSLPPDAEVRSFGDYAALRDLYAAATLVVVPLVDASHAAGYAVIIESMAMGKAVVSTDIQGRSDLIEDGVNGVLVAPGDVQELRSTIVELLDDAARRDELARNARAMVEERWSVERYAKRIKRAALQKEPSPRGISSSHFDSRSRQTSAGVSTRD